ncbi:glycosyltransferase family 2 protein [Dyadobacter tibetensis]|uniref:glycosyltransferase family 2 protein n=1 Tax=Dyadobacter tibetensis TaxID=1211851 RepID=UPI00046F5819|nr:glycosyltransferase family 2 protein [Dyadobacter tibetensis]
MKISIITVVFNGRKTLQSCIDSVLSQDYPDLEYIIIDGNSTDGTQEMVRSYGNKINHLVSEPDQGIYDAMNKGIALASGEVIGILNADDFYTSTHTLSLVAQAFADPSVDASYADLEYVHAQDIDKVTRLWKSGEYKSGAFLNGWMPPHPTFFVRRTCYNRYGNFRLDMGSAADYELMLRLIHKEGIKLAYIPSVLIRMRAGGVSNSALSNRLKANQNDRKAWRVNGIKPRFYTLYMKPLRKILQFL